MKTVVYSAPAIEPVSLPEVKGSLRILHAEHDTVLLPRLIKTAREYVEGMARRKLITQTIDGYLDAWPCSEIVLPFGQLQSVTWVKYTDVNAAQSTFSTDKYLVDTVSEPGRIVLKTDESWPDDELREVNPITVRFVCGWTSAATVPDSLKHAIHLLVGWWYRNPEAALQGSVATVSSDIQHGVEDLIGMSAPLWL